MLYIIMDKLDFDNVEWGPLKKLDFLNDKTKLLDRLIEDLMTQTELQLLQLKHIQVQLKWKNLFEK